MNQKDLRNIINKIKENNGLSNSGLALMLGVHKSKVNNFMSRPKKFFKDEIELVRSFYPSYFDAKEEILSNDSQSISIESHISKLLKAKDQIIEYQKAVIEMQKKEIERLSNSK